ncbi:MAG: cysteine desulfurase [Proteobacteria bacterium]|nr:cysteine desulfurase [Pseudomonadota bacterium]
MIYLDHNATTPIAPEAARAMSPYLFGEFGNPSSEYELGRRAKAALEAARAQVAGLIGAEPGEVVFTSGGTESNNAILKGIFYSRSRPVHIVTSRTEHPAIINPCLFLMAQGAQVTFLRVDGQGLIDPDEVGRAIRPETALVSIMLANNETGVLQPIEEIGRITKARGVPLHTDAAQAVGKIPIDVRKLGVDALSVAGHKIYAPKGVGALFLRGGLEIEPFMHGAGQEAGRRAGTENVVLAVGLGAAAELAAGRVDRDGPLLQEMRDRLEAALMARLPDLVRVGHPDRRLPNTLNVCLPGRAGADILARAPEIQASTGAACHAGQVKVSPVLQEMGLASEVAMGAIRLTLGRLNSPDQIETAAELLAGAAGA